MYTYQYSNAEKDTLRFDTENSKGYVSSILYKNDKNYDYTTDDTILKINAKIYLEIVNHQYDITEGNEILVML